MKSWKICSFVHRVSFHVDHSRGFGGKYGVQKDRQDAVVERIVSRLTSDFDLVTCLL